MSIDYLLLSKLKWVNSTLLNNSQNEAQSLRTQNTSLQNQIASLQATNQNLQRFHDNVMSQNNYSIGGDGHTSSMAAWGCKVSIDDDGNISGELLAMPDYYIKSRD